MHEKDSTFPMQWIVSVSHIREDFHVAIVVSLAATLSLSLSSPMHSIDPFKRGIQVVSWQGVL